MPRYFFIFEYDEREIDIAERRCRLCAANYRINGQRTPKRPSS